MILVLNDQGGRVMSIDEDKTATLRAQEHGHQPVICFEPGIMQRLGREPNVNVSTTLRNNLGDNRPAVCYAIDHVITTGGNCTAQGKCYYERKSPTLKACGVHAVCYAADLHNGTVTGDRCCSLNANTGASANHAGPSVLCVEGHIVDRNTSQNGKG